MNIVRYNPARKWQPVIHNNSDLFNTFFNNFFVPFDGSEDSAEGLKGTVPLKVDIHENDTAIVIEAELPGVEKENIHVDVKGRLLTLSGEHKTEKEEQEGKYHRKERYYGKFERTFTLPFDINGDTVKANYKNGVLTLEIPKPENQAAKQITVN